MIADGIGRHSGRQPFQQRGFAGAVIAGEKGDRRLEFEAFQLAQRRNGKGVFVPSVRSFLHGHAVEKQHFQSSLSMLLFLCVRLRRKRSILYWCIL
ncbi:hypothetical protein D3C87_1451100 [compost metagenome]